MIDAQLVRAAAVSLGLILFLILVALASSRLEPAAGASPRSASAAAS
ncbi:hypothetical protein [Phenylobacterium sp.]|nr:hypothetical protein [Phenylobacterium sp.]